MKEVVQDRYGNTIYLTDERWQHIVQQHRMLKNLKHEVLKTIRIGKREQEDIYSNKFVYRMACKSLLYRYTHIEVVVVFRTTNNQPNNFVVTAYPINMR